MQEPVVDTVVFAALSDATRFAILNRLSNSGAVGSSVSDIATAFSISHSSASQHLKILHTAGLLNRSRQGRRTVYGVNSEKLGQIAHFFGALGGTDPVPAAASPGDSDETAQSFDEQIKLWLTQWPDLDPVALVLRYALGLIGFRLEKLRRDEARKAGLSTQDFSLLGHLSLTKPESNPTALSRSLLIPLPRITQSLDYLEKLGLISRTQSKSDRRFRVICLTQHGSEVYKSIFHSHYTHSYQQAYESCKGEGGEKAARFIWRLAQKLREEQSQPQ